MLLGINCQIVGFFILPIITKDLTAYDYGIAALVSAYAVF